MREEQKIKSNYTVDCVMRWILFGILLVALPPLCTFGYRIIVGFHVNIKEYIPDTLVAVVSVCCNLLSTFVDSEKSISRIIRWLFGIILGVISIVYLGLFFVIRMYNKIELPYSACINIYFVSIWILVGCAIIGTIIEIYTEKKKVKN